MSLLVKHKWTMGWLELRDVVFEEIVAEVVGLGHRELSLGVLHVLPVAYLLT
jgi:hypothetical protein